MKKPIIISLSKEDNDLAVTVGVKRQKGKEGLASTKKYRKEDQSSLGGHIVGVKGEIAAARYLGLQINREVFLTGDGHIDFHLSDGRSVDVQTTVYPDPELKFDDEHPFKADVAVLVRLVEPWQHPNAPKPSEPRAERLELWGWIAREDYVGASGTKNYGYGERRIAGVNVLAEMEELQKAIP